GGDDGGRRLVGELEAGGVEVHAVRAAEPTGAIAVLIGPGGERTMATQRGASVGLRRDDLRPEWFVGVDLIHVPAYSLFREPLATAARTAVEMVRLGRGRVSVDLSSVAGLVDYGPARMMSDLARIKPDILFATAAEADAMPHAMDGLAPVTAAKLGAAGCIVLGRRIASPAADVFDFTGAGHACAAVIVFLIISAEGPLS